MVQADTAPHGVFARSYVHSLEERVAFLEDKLAEHGIRVSDVTAGGHSGSPGPRSSDPEEPEGIVRRVAAGATSTPLPQPGIITRADGSSKGRAPDIVQSLSGRLGLESQADRLSVSSSLLRQLYRVEAMQDGLRRDTADDETTAFPQQQIDVAPADFPNPAVAEHLVKVFFELSNFSTPILHEPTFRAYLALAAGYNTAPSAGVPAVLEEGHAKARFFTFIVFAIALLTIQKHDATNVSTALCERYFVAALHSLDRVGLPPDLEGVQALLLIAFYSYLHPRAFDPWRTIGMALRLAVGMGLHKDLPPESKADALARDTRRRTFWVAYSMDRTVGTLLQRPFSLSDGAIDCAFPSAVDDECIRPDGIDPHGPVGKKAFGLHYFRYRQLQSEIHVALYEKPPRTVAAAAAGTTSINWAAWQHTLHGELTQWLNTQPAAVSTSQIAPPEALQLAYHQAVLLLYRPSPAIPQPSGAALLALADSATRIIHLYRRLHCENKLRLFWQAAHNLFAAGTALLHCYTHSAQMRARTSLRSLDVDIHACSAVLWAMGERFPAARGKRDAFDLIATAALDALSADDTPPAVSAAPQESLLPQLRIAEGAAVDNGSQRRDDAYPAGHLSTRQTPPSATQPATQLATQPTAQAASHLPSPSSDVVAIAAAAAVADAADAADAAAHQPADFYNDQLGFGYNSWPGNMDELLGTQVGSLDGLVLDPAMFEPNIGMTTWI
ncbi:Transcription factor [Niveomyces insectorum RCEF 264]|uniref:Transcription factor n=1 Tax=Niveomyces insectorum RCEF 264 TaxID=1081102 RepID=A0A167M8V6_9HYPO|nr:Transcription factor [Niveomyces insectorum RCEF 264]